MPPDPNTLGTRENAEVPGTGTSVVLVLYNQLELTRACLQSLRATTEQFELCVLDNGSSDGTEAFFRSTELPWPLRYRRRDDNAGLIRGLNEGARLATRGVLCFLHNDTEMREPRWLERLEAALARPGVGLAGLYGARRLRRDGRFVGRTIVHSLAGARGLGASLVEVAAVDGVCLTLRREMFDTVGGFDEGYGFFHGYDRDLSFAVREAGRACVVVDAPFVHHGGGTRTGPRAPRPPAVDLADRQAALGRFAGKWRRRLPCDVRSVKERVADRVAALWT
jgi:GT2 family glycosyltransferase